MKKYKFSLLNLFLCVIVTSLVNMCYPYIFGLLIDEVFYHRNWDLFLYIVVVYGLIFTGEMGLHVILNSTWAYLMTRFLFDFRLILFRTVQSVSSSRLSSGRVGDLMTTLNRDIDEIMNFIHWNVFYLTANVMRLGIAIFFVFSINRYIGLLMIVAVPLSVVISNLYSKRIKTITDAYRNKFGITISWVTEMLNGIRELRLLGSNSQITEQYEQDIRGLTALRTKQDYTETAARQSIAFVTLLSDLSLYALAAYLIVSGDLKMGGLIAAIEYFSRSKQILGSLSQANVRLQQNKVSIARINELLSADTDRRGTRKIKGDIQNIRMDGVGFSYGDEKKVLRDVHLNINKGEKIAVIGPSGAGKSTIASLIIGLYEPQSGKISINGTSHEDLSLAELRGKIGYISQDPYVVDGTIRSNLMIGSARKTDEDLWRVLDEACLGDMALALKNGLDTVINSEGLQLSGGQKQRLAIARVLLRNPEVIIMDEATSSLDNETEATLLALWETSFREKTVITIAHRLTSILGADKVAILQEGTIAAFDTQENLYRENAYFRQLMDAQINPGGEQNERNPAKDSA
ncbi:MULTISPECIES: ABC transporter ATP-binding protein [unclassified Paenibacillus]|uniref:ABC transporter ATP-binding protein n=1 Tax=unclassified Paenibacillus TaxID=185978 RepID=UPI00159F72EF|nr:MULTISPECIES: ABC transporter ATP-binding protein [unclassified Paenibacillus]